MKHQMIDFTEFRRRLNDSEEAFDAVMAPGMTNTVLLKFRSENPDVNGVLVQLFPHGSPGFSAPEKPHRFAKYLDHVIQAQSEGWAMFEVDGRWMLQRDDEENKFESDAEAILFEDVGSAG